MTRKRLDSGRKLPLTAGEETDQHFETFSSLSKSQMVFLRHLFKSEGDNADSAFIRFSKALSR